MVPTWGPGPWPREVLDQIFTDPQYSWTLVSPRCHPNNPSIRQIWVRLEKHGRTLSWQSLRGSGVLELTLISLRRILNISSQFHVQSCHLGNLTSAMIGILIPQKSPNSTNQKSPTTPPRPPPPPHTSPSELLYLSNILGCRSKVGIFGICWSLFWGFPWWLR